MTTQVERKFTNSLDLAGWEIMTDTGWEELSGIHQTIPYTIWKLELFSGKTLECADTHILFNEKMEEVFVCDLSSGDIVQTDIGPDVVVKVQSTNDEENMYDVTVASVNHRFYSNGILSHNTATAAGYLLWYAMFNADSTVLAAAHKFSGASEIINRVKYGYENCPDFLRAGVVEYNKQSIVFDNGSRIVAQTTTANTGRGLSVHLAYCDELAFVRGTIGQDMFTSVSLTLAATGGKFIITSTPNSDEDLFATVWKEANDLFDEYGNEKTDGIGKNGFKAFFAEWSEHPDRDEAWAESQKAMLSPEKYARDILCQFVISEETLIAPTKLSKLFGTDPVLIENNVRWFAQPKPNGHYVVALDPSMGTGGDYASIQIVDAETYEQIGEWCHNKTVIEKQVEILQSIVKHLSEVSGDKHNVYYSVENNSLGEAILVAIRAVGEENIEGVFLSEPRNGKDRRKGFNTTPTAKLTACSQLKAWIESDKMKIRGKKTISELKTFVSTSNTFKAKPGEHDDLVMAMVLAVRMLDIAQKYVEASKHMDDDEDDDFDFDSVIPFSVSYY